MALYLHFQGLGVFCRQYTQGHALQLLLQRLAIDLSRKA